MTDRELALLGVVIGLIGFMQREGIIDRERLIDYLLEMMAADPRWEAGSALHEMFESVVRMLEHTQFPPERPLQR